MTHDAAARFAACLAEVLRHEGGYADHPLDPGGATNLGITRETLARWRGVATDAVSKAAVRALTRDEAASIYRRLYWDAVAGDALPPGVDLAVFDYAVNSGPARAIRALQRALGVTADGIIGPVTLAALAARVASGGSASLVTALCAGRLGFLRSLATFATFGRGWTSRVDGVLRTALAMAGAEPTELSPKRDLDWRETMDIFVGYRTYIVAGLMILAAIAQIAGVDLPALDGHSAGQLLMEALAIVFLRRGIESKATRT